MDASMDSNDRLQYCVIGSLNETVRAVADRTKLCVVSGRGSLTHQRISSGSYGRDNNIHCPTRVQPVPYMNLGIETG